MAVPTRSFPNEASSLSLMSRALSLGRIGALARCTSFVRIAELSLLDLVVRSALSPIWTESRERTIVELARVRGTLSDAVTRMRINRKLTRVSLPSQSAQAHRYCDRPRRVPGAARR